MNLSYAHCPNCGVLIVLNEKVELFDSEDNSVVTFKGKCHICGYNFGVSYPLSRSEPG